MYIKQDIAEKLAQILVNNAGNRLTQELINGMAQEMIRCLPDDIDEHNDTTANTDVKE